MKVVNCRKEHCTHYCGRPDSYNKALGQPVNLSLLGNPFPMHGEHERHLVIKQYRAWLYRQWKENTQAWQSVTFLPKDAVLGCFCAPLDCHCDVIIRAWNAYNEKRL